jgi:hypothetical protein
MIYITRYGDQYDLSTWPKSHLAFVQRAHWLYWQHPPYEEFVTFILGPSSPVLNRKLNGPNPTRTPLYEVATDLEFRLAVKQGVCEKDWEGDLDPSWPEPVNV